MALSNLSGYAVGGSAGGSTTSSDDRGSGGYWTLAQLKRAFLDYVGSKREEIDEQQDADRWINGSHWTGDEIRQLNARKQPIVWENLIKRNIDRTIGKLVRLKLDPKAYPRTPKHEEGAELATAVLNFIKDQQKLDAIDARSARVCATRGLSGVEINLVRGDHGDTDIEVRHVNKEGYFYDPRSKEPDFSDAMFQGYADWYDLDVAIANMPDKREELEASVEADTELTTNSDGEQRWFRGDADRKQVRLVECWYKAEGKWLWCVFTGSAKIKEGKSYLKNEKEESLCKYRMFSCYIDQDWDRYGFVRDMKPQNRELNMRKSKSLFMSLSRPIMAEAGAFDDIEVARREAARPDGVVIRNKGFEAEFDDNARQANIETQFKFCEATRQALSGFGVQLTDNGQGLDTNLSGRAINLLQQEALAEIGPFVQSYRDWKRDVYRVLWNAAQQHWTGERWIRVTDDDDVAQFIQLNGVGIDPQTGMPTLVNAIGSLDVDIILDEGPDEVNMMGDASDALQLIAGKAAAIPPELIKPYLELLIEWSPAPQSFKKKALEKFNPEPTPQAQAQQQLQMRGAVAEVSGKEADAQLKQAQTVKTMREAQVVQPEQPDMQAPGEHPMTVHSEAIDKQASAMQKAADAQKKKAETAKIIQDIQLEPQRMAMEQQNQAVERAMQAQQAERNFEQAAKDSDRNYQVNKLKAKSNAGSKR